MRLARDDLGVVGGGLEAGGGPGGQLRPDCDDLGVDEEEVFLRRDLVPPSTQVGALLVLLLFGVEVFNYCNPEEVLILFF